jgi:hypothetical protein
MRRVITALFVLAGATTAIGQTVSPNPNGPASTDPGKNAISRGAPVGHRQPRAKDLSPNIYTSNDAREVAAEKQLDRKIKGICHGC